MTTTTTQAHEAQKALHAELVKIPQSYCNSYDHVLVCHGCGTFHAVNTHFLSSPVFIGFDFADGSRLCVPAHACNDCMGKDVIRRAYNEGMSRGHYDRAAKHLGAKLRPYVDDGGAAAERATGVQ
jgi:hypothetical protein